VSARRVSIEVRLASLAIVAAASATTTACAAIWGFEDLSGPDAGDEVGPGRDGGSDTALAPPDGSRDTAPTDGPLPDSTVPDDAPTDTGAQGGGDATVCSTGWVQQAEVFEGGTMQAAVSGVWGSSAADVYAVGFDPSDDAVIVHSTGNGVWTRQTVGSGGMQQGLVSVWGSGAGDVYAAGNEVIFHSTGNGTWTSEDVPGGSYGALWGSGPGDVYALSGGTGGFVAHSTGDGTWTVLQTSLGSQVSFAGIWGSSAADVYVVGGDAMGNPLIAHSSGGSSMFVAQTVPVLTSFEDSLVAVWGSGAADVYALSTNGTILHSTGNGTWAAQVTATQINYDYFAIWGSGPNDIYIGTTGGEALHSTGNGSWSNVAIGTANQVSTSHLWGSGPCDVYAVGSDIDDDGVILHGP
jgi:hypothetical protein